MRIRISEGQIECGEREQLMWFGTASAQHFGQSPERRLATGSLEFVVGVVSIYSESLRAVFLMDALNSTASVNRPVVTRNDYGQVPAEVDKLGVNRREPERACEVDMPASDVDWSRSSSMTGPVPAASASIAPI